MTFDVIDDAFHYVSNAPPGERAAWIQRGSGKVFLSSTKAGFDERPPGAAGDPDYLAIPHRFEIDPGKELMLEFAHAHCPRELRRIEGLFERSGAFRKVKDLFKQLGLLDHWQIFEEEQIAALLRQWCVAEGLELSSPAARER